MFRMITGIQMDFSVLACHKSGGGEGIASEDSAKLSFLKRRIETEHPL